MGTHNIWVHIYDLQKIIRALDSMQNEVLGPNKNILQYKETISSSLDTTYFYFCQFIMHIFNFIILDGSDNPRLRRRTTHPNVTAH